MDRRTTITAGHDGWADSRGMVDRLNARAPVVFPGIAQRRSRYCYAAGHRPGRRRGGRGQVGISAAGGYRTIMGFVDAGPDARTRQHAATSYLGDKSFRAKRPGLSPHDAQSPLTERFPRPRAGIRGIRDEPISPRPLDRDTVPLCTRSAAAACPDILKRQHGMNVAGDTAQSRWECTKARLYRDSVH